MMATAMNTVAVWISAIAADSSELELSQELTIAGAITLEFGPIRKIETPSSRTEAMKISSHAATRPGPQQRHGHGAHLIDPAGAADARAFLEARIDLQHDAGDGAQAERQEHGEVGHAQQPQRAVDRDRHVDPRPQQAETEHQPRHRLREHDDVFRGAAPGHARAVDDPGQHADHDDADRRDRNAQDQAVDEGRSDRAHLQRGLVVGQRELHLRQDHRGEALERGEQQRGQRQDHRDDDVAPGDGEQRPAHRTDIHLARAERLAGDRGVGAVPQHEARERQPQGVIGLADNATPPARGRLRQGDHRQGDPSYRTVKGILAAGTEATTAAEPAGDGGAAAFLHGPAALFAAEPLADDDNVVPLPGRRGRQGVMTALTTRGPAAPVMVTAIEAGRHRADAADAEAVRDAGDDRGPPRPGQSRGTRPPRVPAGPVRGRDHPTRRHAIAPAATARPGSTSPSPWRGSTSPQARSCPPPIRDLAALRWLHEANP